MLRVRILCVLSKLVWNISMLFVSVWKPKGMPGWLVLSGKDWVFYQTFGFSSSAALGVSQNQMTLKSGVRVLGIKPEALLGILIAQSVYQQHNTPCVITSVVEGIHSRGSIHYQGLAFDLRLPIQDVGTIVKELQEGLGSDFDVVLESDHIHIEFQPKLRA